MEANHTTKLNPIRNLRPPVEKRDDDGMHDIEFRVVEVIQEADCVVKLEDEEVEKEDEGNATNAKDRRQVFGPTTSEEFDNIRREI